MRISRPGIALIAIGAVLGALAVVDVWVAALAVFTVAVGLGFILVRPARPRTKRGSPTGLTLLAMAGTVAVSIVFFGGSPVVAGLAALSFVLFFSGAVLVLTSGSPRRPETIDDL